MMNEYDDHVEPGTLRRLLARRMLPPRPVFDQIAIAYRRMAQEARYRPAAPSDGLGSITIPIEECDLDAEIAAYAVRWDESEDAREFSIGCCNSSTRPATIYAIEAARSLCGASDDLALDLLRMAVKDLEQQLRRP